MVISNAYLTRNRDNWQITQTPNAITSANYIIVDRGTANLTREHRTFSCCEEITRHTCHKAMTDRRPVRGVEVKFN